MDLLAVRRNPDRAARGSGPSVIAVEAPLVSSLSPSAIRQVARNKKFGSGLQARAVQRAKRAALLSTAYDPLEGRLGYKLHLLECKDGTVGRVWTREGSPAFADLVAAGNAEALQAELGRVLSNRKQIGKVRA
jgi:hypothetical protein